jgi:hypothetical protein
VGNVVVNQQDARGARHGAWISGLRAAVKMAGVYRTNL